mmetsp:Transcript_95123/g.188442  ORF Transcript_95123/g.188442 Transcript_95123/m.188442 type:complete len:238 (+) Transcript_95123:265-978(+)
MCAGLRSPTHNTSTESAQFRANESTRRNCCKHVNLCVVNTFIAIPCPVSPRDNAAGSRYFCQQLKEVGFVGVGEYKNSPVLHQLPYMLCSFGSTHSVPFKTHRVATSSMQCNVFKRHEVERHEALDCQTHQVPPHPEGMPNQFDIFCMWCEFFVVCILAEDTSVQVFHTSRINKVSVLRARQCLHGDCPWIIISGKHLANRQRVRVQHGGNETSEVVFIIIVEKVPPPVLIISQVTL